MPVKFAGLAEELAAARQGSAVADGSMFAALEMTGPDRHDFLNRLLTNSVPTQPGAGCEAYFLSVMGRPLVQLFVFEEGERTLLICPRSQREAAFAELDKMHFGEKLRFKHLEVTPTLVFAPSLRPGFHLSSVEGTPVAQFEFFSCPHQLWLKAGPVTGTPIGAQALEVLRIEAASPTPGDYFEKTLFLEVARPDCYSETKGCYPGQEVVARTLHRGHINRHLLLLVTDEMVPERDSRLLLDDKEVGYVASAVRSVEQVLVLAYLRREVWEPGTELVLQGSLQRLKVTTPEQPRL